MGSIATRVVWLHEPGNFRCVGNEVATRCWSMELPSSCGNKTVQCRAISWLACYL